MSYVVIYDTVAWSTGSKKDEDLEYHTLSRGDTVPDSVPAEKVKDWLDTDKFGPHGAIAEEGTALAGLGSSGVSVALDPAEARRRFLDAAGEEAVITDPAMRPNDQPADTQDPGVSRSRTLVNRGTGTAHVAPRDEGTPELAVDDMKKDQLQAMADGLGIEYAKKDSADSLREKIQTHMASGDQPVTPAGE